MSCGSYTGITKLILVLRILYLSYGSYTCFTELILIQILYLFRFLVCRTELIHVLILISSLYLFRSPVGVTKLMLIQRYLNTYWYLYLSQISRRSLQNLYLYYRVYTCSEVPVGITEITERILVLRNLFLYGSTCKYYKTYTGTSYLILVLRSTSWSYGTYTCIIELILVFKILFLYEGTRRYNKSEQIKIISHTRSDQTYTDTDISPS